MRGRLVASLQSAIIFLKFVHFCPFYGLSVFFFFCFLVVAILLAGILLNVVVNRAPLKDFDSFIAFFFFRTRISQFITGSIYTVFTCGVVLWVKWKATESLILLFIPWYRLSSVQLSKLTHAPVELFKEAEHSFSSNSLSLYCVWEHLYHEEICSH